VNPFDVGGPEDEDDSYGAFSPPPERRRRPPLYPEERRQTLVGLRWNADSGLWTSKTVSLFRPMGLIVENAPPGALLRRWMTGNIIDLPYGPAPIALSVFRRLETQSPERTGDAVWRPHFSPCGVTESITLEVTDAEGKPLGPPLELTVWGIAVR
jgi:hypothetical protein